ncbi:MAG: universal stress protein [Bacteroidota bacterium]
MKNMIAAFDGLKYTEATEKFALYISKKTNTHLTGIFLDDEMYTSYKAYKLLLEKKLNDKTIEEAQQQDKQARRAAAMNFEVACKKAGIVYSVHHDPNVAVQELVHESIYADLLLMYAGETFTHYAEPMPTLFVRDVLSNVQCPVLLLPRKFATFKRIVILYDGAPSSVYAIKMFSYLLPQLLNLPTEVFSVVAKDDLLQLVDAKAMKEFMQAHYPRAKYTLKKGKAEEVISKHLKTLSKDTLVVLGAYKRGMVSRWFRESMADIVMRETELPIFVAHNK